VESENTDTKCT